MARPSEAKTPVVGITGTGGAGKSSLTDELIRRLRLDQQRPPADRGDLASIPSRRKSGGALLGDRIRMNAIGPWSDGPRVYMRSLATRDFGSEISAALPDVLAAVKAAGFDLVIVETSGIGQGDAAIVPLVDVPVYVMTPEFGAASQLEKIDMLDFAEFVVINKFDRKGAADALRDVAKQVQRNREAFGKRPDEMPVFGTMASRFNDDGVTALYQALAPRLAGLGLKLAAGKLPKAATRHSTHQVPIVPGSRTRYLADIVDAVRAYKREATAQARLAREIQQLRASARMLTEANPDKSNAVVAVNGLADEREARLDRRARRLLAMWPEMQKAYARRRVRGQDPRQGDPHLARPHDALGQQDQEGRAARVRGPRRDPQVAAARQRAGHRSRTPRERSRSSARTRTRRACSPARATRSAPTAASSCSRRACPPSACRPRSIRSRSTATTRRAGPTSTARSATRASRSRRSTT